MCSTPLPGINDTREVDCVRTPRQLSGHLVMIDLLVQNIYLWGIEEESGIQTRSCGENAENPSVPRTGKDKPVDHRQINTRYERELERTPHSGQPSRSS